MAIEARCPNGHKIVCPEDRAGRTAKCPKCSAAFRIPEPQPNGRPKPAAAPAANSDDDLATAAVLAGGSTPSAVAAAQAETDPVSGVPGDEAFLFLCPNGHKLHGPVRLAGKVGKCPHCRAKFEIPVPHLEDDEDEPDGLDDTVTEDPLHDFGDEGSGQLSADAAPFEPAQNVVSDELAEPQNLFEPLSADAGNSPRETPLADTTVPPPLPTITASRQVGDAAHPLAELVARLWAERDHGGIIELHLSGGALLAPEWFDGPCSGGDYGLFASQAADGTVTMTVVPWSEVTRVVVRGVVGLPDGMFE